MLVSSRRYPFKAVDDGAMFRTTENTAQYGVLMPLTMRPLENGSHEIISGHRRIHTAELARFTEVPVLVRRVDDDVVTVPMVDSSLQRENISPNERAYAYEMKSEATKRQTRRLPKENGGQLDYNLFGKKVAEIIAGESGDSIK